MTASEGLVSLEGRQLRQVQALGHFCRLHWDYQQFVDVDECHQFLIVHLMAGKMAESRALGISPAIPAAGQAQNDQLVAAIADPIRNGLFRYEAHFEVVISAECSTKDLHHISAAEMLKEQLTAIADGTYEMTPSADDGRMNQQAA